MTPQQRRRRAVERQEIRAWLREQRRTDWELMLREHERNDILARVFELERDRDLLWLAFRLGWGFQGSVSMENRDG